MVLTLCEGDQSAAIGVQYPNGEDSQALKVTRPGRRSQKAHDFTVTFCGGLLYSCELCHQGCGSCVEDTDFQKCGCQIRLCAECVEKEDS